MLLILLFIHPVAWQARYAPFLWFFPLLCLMSIPEKRRIFLWVPFSIAIVNVAGIFCFQIAYDWQMWDRTNRICSAYAGETIMLPKTVFEYDGIFDRYGIRQKFVNPEETFFYRRSNGLGHLALGRTPDGVNVFFKEDLLPLPEIPLVLTEDESFQWLVMSEGLMPVEATDQDFTQRTEWRTYSDKVKFYMSLDKEPKEDWELTLKGSVFDDRWDTTRVLEVLIFINNREIGTWQIDKNSSSAAFTIPKILLEESLGDETRLVTLMLRLPEIQRPPLIEHIDQASNYGLSLEEMQICPK